MCDRGNCLVEVLFGGVENWYVIFVDESGLWNFWYYYDYEVDDGYWVIIVEYLDVFGYLILIEKGCDDEVNYVIGVLGLFYLYGRGGSIIIIDFVCGKVYFVYVG